ncbi:methionine--tRNA ligase, cytoplasmic [Copidosoma floridanum]|uniref:methionine--tRNA ligase, cytoplasmic n=1 Tax=Copidosoma floridanum TaxID=29053 RepID=UPI0006C9D157|nr:methionine--tRNA ligase, cytoplasmic [Copidosoma floridanum]
MQASSNSNNPNVLKLIIAAELAGCRLDLDDLKREPKQSFANRLPVLKISSTGDELFSLSSAVQYIAPVGQEHNVDANRWLEWDATQLLPAIVAYGGSGKLDTSHKPRIWSLLKELNTALKDKEYLIKCKNVTVVDTTIWVTLWSTLVTTEIGEIISKEFSNLSKWLKSIESLPEITKSLEKVQLERGIQAIVAISAAAWYPLNLYTGAEKLSNAQAPAAHEKNPVDEVKVISEEELNAVKNNWSSVAYSCVKDSQYPILPKKGEKNILITSALPYVNNVPHLGNIIGCVLSADIFARYCRQRNYNTLYISGTDEYGTATEAKALEEKMTPQEICNKYFDIHNDIYRWFNIGFDYFGRTSTPEQTEVTQEIFLRVLEQGYVISNSVDQLLCGNCDKFLADRFVEGTCPGCKYEDARGDQCDGCGHLINAIELINPRCKVCNSRPTIKASTQLFLDLPKIEKRLQEWAPTVTNGWSAVARSVMKPWLRDGLKQRCITRDLKWGIPVPLDGYRDKVFYVWFDAPIGYISITKKYTKEYEQWWKPKDVDVDLYQFMAKDNVPFHSIMFPATLFAANQGHTIIKYLMATEYLNYEDTKFSKSRGVGVFGSDARETGIPADVWRFYLAYIRPENMDSNFNWVDLATKNNSELLNNFGNFVNRALMFVEKNFDSKVPEINLQADDLRVLALIQRELTSYVTLLEQAKLRDGLRHVLAISKHGNQYMQYQQPWVKVKGDEEEKKKGATVIGVCCNIACLLSALIAPYMPNTARELRAQLGLTKQNYGYIPEVVTLMLSTGHSIGKPSPLFTKIEDSRVEELRKSYAGRQEPTPPPKGTSAPHADVATLEASIAKQGDIVRQLKATEEKSVWLPQVEILKKLKQKLADLQSKSKPEISPSIAQTASPNLTTPATQHNSVPADVAELESAIAKQGNLVRELKAQGDKSVWEPQVKVLLQMKQKLSELTGSTTAAPSHKKSKKKK